MFLFECAILPRPLPGREGGKKNGWGGEGNGSLSFKTPVGAPVGQGVWFQAVELGHGALGAVVSEVQEAVIVE